MNVAAEGECLDRTSAVTDLLEYLRRELHQLQRPGEVVESLVEGRERGEGVGHAVSITGYLADLQRLLQAIDRSREITELDDGGYLLDARMPVDDLADLVGVELPDEDWDTVGGLLLGLAGRVPLEGEVFEYDGLVFEAVRVQGRRIAEVRVNPR